MHIHGQRLLALIEFKKKKIAPHITKYEKKKELEKEREKKMWNIYIQMSCMCESMCVGWVRV